MRELEWEPSKLRFERERGAAHKSFGFGKNVKSKERHIHLILITL